jgi:hypothetical protein
MNALPYFRLDIQTTLSVEEERRRLNGHLHPRRPWRLVYQSCPPGYEGVVYEDGGFRLNRLISYQNACLPVVYGQIDGAHDGARVRAFASLHPIVVVMLIGVLLVFSFEAWSQLTAAAASGRLIASISVWLAALALVYAIILGFFWLEAVRVRKFVSDLYAPFTRRPTSACSGARAARSHLCP